MGNDIKSQIKTDKSNGKMLRLFTSQHFSVLNTVKQKGIYIPNGTHSHYYRGNTNEAYRLIIDKLKAYPVWLEHALQLREGCTVQVLIKDIKTEDILATYPFC